MNQVVLTGNLGADPDIHVTGDGNQIASFSLAFRSGKKKTGWIRVCAFNRLSEVVERYLHKGARIAVIGSLDQEKWESNGEARTAYKLIAQTIEFIKTDGRGFEEGRESDDIPF